MPIVISPKAVINLSFLSIGTLMLGIHYLFPDFEVRYSYPILFGVVISLGLVHGCLDFEIAKNTNPQSKLLNFLTNYLAQILALSLVWLFNPQLALLIFLACTAWHFGETDLSLFKLNVNTLVIWVYGIGITTWLLGNHLEDNIQYIYDLGFAQPSNDFLQTNIHQITIGLRIVALAFIGFAVYFSGLYHSKSNLVLLFAMLSITYLLPILSAFTVYFGFWHSLHTLRLIKVDIKITTKGLFLKAAPYLVVSIIMTVLMILGFALFNLGSETVLLVFISSLTLPHASTMHSLLLRYRLG